MAATAQEAERVQDFTRKDAYIEGDNYALSCIPKVPKVHESSSI